MKNRRQFIQKSAVIGAGAFLPLQFCTSPKKEENTVIEAVVLAAKGILDDFGIQIYSVKENMAEDAVATIRALASYGYTQIEGFDGGKGIFWGMKNTEFKALMDGLGLDFIASHADTFVEGAKQHFVAVQKAWDQADASEIESYCTPELFAEIKTLMQDMVPGENHTEIDTLYSELADQSFEGDYFIVSIRFSGFIKEERDAESHAFNEIWHIRRLAAGEGNWLIAGIQQQA